MSKRTGKKRKQPQTRQQQQEAAARRRAPVTAKASMQQSAASSEGPTARQPAPYARADAESAASAPGHYLDVSVVRIQEWLARAPDLKSRRGASILLTEVTGRYAWPDERLPSGMAWNDEAGDLDGVVALVAQDAVAEGDLPSCISAAAREVSAELRRKMPHCAIQAVAGTGDSYAWAWQEINRARRDGDFVVDVPPVPAEAILAKPCDNCRAAPATERSVEIEGRERRKDLCSECLCRVHVAGGTKGDRPRRSPRPEQRMKAALLDAGMSVTGFPDDFRQLAEAGARDGDDAATQLGLIYADGNRVGAFLSEAACHARKRGTPAKAEIVPALDGATLAALADAALTCFPGWPRPAVMAHLAGGDDLMVSVPAGYAWPFTRTLLAAFSRRICLAAADWPRPVREQVPSMSAGIVFHHQSAPFSDVVRLAKAQLDEAKKAVHGAAASVAFLDLTADGGHRPACRAVLTLADLDKNADLLAEVALIPHSHRETLAALHRRSGDAAARDYGRGETPGQTFARRVADLGYQPLLDAIAGPGAGSDAARAALASAGKRDELRRVLDLARWWPPPAKPSAAQADQAPAAEGMPA